jgi:heme exporter protein D
MNFDMAPYGAYIWPAYGISALALGGLVLWAVAAWHRAKSRLAALEENA